MAHASLPAQAFTPLSLDCCVWNWSKQFSNMEFQTFSQKEHVISKRNGLQRTMIARSWQNNMYGSLAYTKLLPKTAAFDWIFSTMVVRHGLCPGSYLFTILSNLVPPSAIVALTPNTPNQILYNGGDQIYIKTKIKPVSVCLLPNAEASHCMEEGVEWSVMCYTIYIYNIYI